jgi:uncharacterized protein YjaZ
MRYFSSEEQFFNFLIIVFIFISDVSFRKIVKSDIFRQRNLRSFSKKQKKMNKDLRKMIKKKEFLIVTKEKTRVYVERKD